MRAVLTTIAVVILVFVLTSVSQDSINAMEEAANRTIMITSDPPGAYVTIADASVFLEQTPAELRIPVGNYQYRVAFEDWQDEFDLYKPFRGTLNVTDDDGVSVWLDRRTEADIAARQAEREENAEVARCANEAENYPLVVENWSWRISSNYAIAEGKVTNQGNATLEYVQAVVEFSTEAGDFITADESYLEYTTLLPGQSSPFEVYADYNPAMNQANIGFSHNFGERIGAIGREDSCNS